ncbi:hypothetical protein SC206_07690 [Rouxiella sp. T17]|uniref:hypothetical protein n=1 Tax=Rouxiella sp. T17 TaxID=3085684 RepID=UPI002FC5FECE
MLNNVSSAFHRPAPSAPPLECSQPSSSYRPDAPEFTPEDQQRLAEQVFTALQQPCDKEIADALKALDLILLSAEQQASELVNEQPVDAQHLQQQAARYIFDNEKPMHHELETALRGLPSSLTDVESNQRDTPGCWARLMKLLTIVNNGLNGMSHHCQVILNYAARAVLCVGIPTLARQLIAYELESALNNCGASKSQRSALASVAALLPVLLNIAGGLRDHWQGTETSVTRFARGFNILISSASLIAAASTGVLSGLTSTLVAFQGYSLLREGLQTCLRMTPTSEIQKKSTLITAGLYVPNQIGVSMAMSLYASPSGAAAAVGNTVSSEILALNNVVRAGMNTAGEALDTYVFSGLHALQNGQRFEGKFFGALPDQKYLADALFNALAARSTLMNTPLLISASLESAFGEYFDAEMRIQINDVLVAGVLGACYPNFIDTITGHKLPDEKE